MNITGIFAKEPVPGKTKTRLAATIGDSMAADLYEAFVIDLLEHFGKTSQQLFVGYTPNTPSAESWFQEHTGSDHIVLPQPGNDLGSRIEWFFREAFNHGATRAVLIGSDSPDLPADLVDEAFERLNDADIVLGPAADGGYVLIGLAAFQRDLFRSVHWSSSSTLLDTIAAAQGRNLSIALLPLWYDIDTVENLGTLLALQTTPGSTARSCQTTRARLESHWPQIVKSIGLRS